MRVREMEIVLSNLSFWRERESRLDESNNVKKEWV